MGYTDTLSLPSTLIRHENGAFRKHFSNRRYLKTPALHFSVDRNHFENEAFQKRRGYENCDISLPEFSSNTNPKQTGDCQLRFQISPA